MDDDKFRKLIKKHILERKWAEIEEQWISFLPSIEPAGSEPDPSLTDFTEFQGVANDLHVEGEPSLRYIPGLREIVFRESIFLLHKASHAIGCAEVSATLGAQTWSLCGSYQGALFAAKSIIYLLGVALPEHESKLVLTDIWAKEEKPKRQIQSAIAPERERPIQFVKVRHQLQHRHLWLLFQRLLNVSKVDIWKSEYVTAFRKLDVSEFAQQRNIVYNRNNGWIFDDLHRFVVDETFGTHSVDLYKSLDYLERSDFSLTLGLVVLHMALSLFDALTKRTNKIKKEIALMKGRMSEPYHPLYHASDFS